VLLGLLVALASVPADATTSLSLVASGDFTPGSVITIETRVTADAGETDNTVFGRLLYPGSLVDGPLEGLGSQHQNSLPGAGWILGSLSCTTTYCLAFNQLNSIGPTAINVTDFLLATNTFTIELDALPGSVLNFNFTSTPMTSRLDFFGISSIPGTSVTVVPEPAAAALFVLGLCGLVAASRRRT